MAAIKEAIKNAGKLPRTLVTDGLRSYIKGHRAVGNHGK
jgi:hypothetical protein